MGLFSTLFAKRSQLEPATEPAALINPPEAAPEPTLVSDATPASVVLAPAEPEAAPPADSGQVRAQAEELVRSVVRELPDFITVAVVNGASGRILAGQWAGHSGGAVKVAVANAEIVRQTHLAIAALQLGPAEQLEDILITLRHQLHLLRVLPQAGWLLYLAIRTQDTNLGLARTVLRSHAV